MTQKGKVPIGELSAYERWELPHIGDSETAASRAKPQKVKEKIKPLTAANIEEIRLQAYEAGFEEGRQSGNLKGHEEGLTQGKELGHQEGLQQGLSEGQSRIEEQLDQLRTLLEQLGDPLTQQQAILEQAIVNVSMAVARAVIYRELSLDSSSIQTALSQLLSTLPKLDVGTALSINGRDEITIQELLQSINSNIELKIDDSITAGGCKLETSRQLIDYTIEKRFQKIVYSTLFAASQADSESQAKDVVESIQDMSDFPTDVLGDAESSLTGLDADGADGADGADDKGDEDEAPKNESDLA